MFIDKIINRIHLLTNNSISITASFLVIQFVQNINYAKIKALEQLKKRRKMTQKPDKIARLRINGFKF